MFGLEASLAAAKLKVEVMSPVVCRRQAVRFGTSTPYRCSTSRSCEVWAKVSLATSPPREYGESTRPGARKPRPIGPAMRAELFPLLRGETVASAPGVPGG